MLRFWVFCLLFFGSISSVLAAVWINEISPSTNPEWIELYNDGQESVDLSDWRLEDANSSKTDDLTLSGSIAPGRYLVFSRSDGWLNNSGDTVKLIDNATPSAIRDQYTYGSVSSDKTISRSPDGSENWVTTDPSQGSANPTPTPTPTPTPSPTQTPTPTPTPSPSPAPTLAPSPTPKPSVKPSPSPNDEATVAGAMIEINLAGYGNSPSPSPGPTQKPKLNTTRARTALIMGTGLILISLSGYLGYRKYKQKKTDSLV